MSQRIKQAVIGCKGWVTREPFGDLVTMLCAECMFKESKGCQEFRQRAKFTKIRQDN